MAPRDFEKIESEIKKLDSVAIYDKNQLNVYSSSSALFNKE